MNDKVHIDNSRPTLAKCIDIELLAPLRWLTLGWKDFLKAPKYSIVYGFVVVLISYFVFSMAWYFNSVTLALSLLSAFVFIAPILCIGLYSIARQLKNDIPLNFRRSLKHGFSPYGDLMIFVIIMMVISLLWARAASMIHVFIPVNAEAGFIDLAIFLGIGSFVGSIFALIIFSASVFSLPMIMDKETDMITACISSFSAVLNNKTAMIFWALIIVILTGIGIFSAFIGFLVIVPLLGYSTWHGYRECLDVSEWNDRESVFTRSKNDAEDNGPTESN